jgi:outer membrane protein assembly factor BamD (BamD/ComL family)
MKLFLPFLLSLTSSCFAGHLYEMPEIPGYPSQEACIVSKKERPTLTLEEHLKKGRLAFEEKNWQEAIKHFRIVKYNHLFNEQIQELLFSLGVCYMETEELECANSEFNGYLRGHPNPTHFAEVIEYKFKIAEAFKNGAKRRWFGSLNMPKLGSGFELALEIYDEVIGAVPSHDIAVKSLYSKGVLLWKMKEYQESVETLQFLTKRFPGHELCPEAFIALTKIYLDQGEYEYQNPDLVAFSEINQRRFQEEFPKDPRLNEISEDVLKMKETYANGLYQTGLFYERKGKPLASMIYYKNAVSRFPETQVATLCQKRLDLLGQNKGT